MVADAPDLPPPGRVGRWLTERFNDWPEGSRDATLAATASGASRRRLASTALDGAPADD